MSRGLGKIQRKILSVLKDLNRRGETREGWVSLNIIIIMVYRAWQIDPEHPANKERIGGRRKDWSYREAERTSVTRAVLRLEKLGMVKGKILTAGRKGKGGIRRWKAISGVEGKEEKKKKIEDERILEM